MRLTHIHPCIFPVWPGAAAAEIKTRHGAENEKPVENGVYPSGVEILECGFPVSRSRKPARQYVSVTGAEYPLRLGPVW
jgi:hypothetical protein